MKRFCGLALVSINLSCASHGPSAIQCPPRGEFNPRSGYYSQFYEDYILSYVFRDVRHGTYVDVGANDPDENSVTKYFYLLGWRGVNIEPNPDMLALLEKARTEDVNVGVGISDTPGTLTFYRAKRLPGLSTFDRDIALRHQARGLAFDEISLPVDSLDAVLDRNEKVKHGFTFLNVDAEGFERRVFASVDFKQHPATVVIAEAKAPLTQDPTYSSWESLLFRAGYAFALDDGLNRYYLHPSHNDLRNRFVEINYCVEQDKIAKSLRTPRAQRP